MAFTILSSLLNWKNSANFDFDSRILINGNTQKQCSSWRKFMIPVSESWQRPSMICCCHCINCFSWLSKQAFELRKCRWDAIQIGLQVSNAAGSCQTGYHGRLLRQNDEDGLTLLRSNCFNFSSTMGCSLMLLSTESRILNFLSVLCFNVFICLLQGLQNYVCHSLYGEELSFIKPPKSWKWDNKFKC